MCTASGWNTRNETPDAPQSRGFRAFRSTIRAMARTPDGAASRELSITTRMTHADGVVLDSQRSARGGMSRSGYIRWLIREDGKRISREKGR